MRYALATICLLACLAAPAAAQQAQGLPAGITLSPALLEVPVSPGERGQRSVTVTNSEATRVAINISFSSLVPEGELLSESESQRYDAASWLQVQANESLILEGGESTSITFGYQVPNNAAPGGNYAFANLQVLTSNPGDNPVQTIPEIAAPILFTVKGPVTERITLSPLSAPTFTMSDSYAISTRLVNSGNVHVLPRVQASTSAQTQDVTPTLSLPGTTNSVEVAIATPGNDWWRWGRQQATITATYDSPPTEITTATKTVWLLPAWWALAIYGLSLAALIIMWRGRYNLSLAWRIIRGKEITKSQLSAFSALRSPRDDIVSQLSEGEISNILSEIDMTPGRKPRKKTTQNNQDNKQNKS